MLGSLQLYNTLTPKLVSNNRLIESKPSKLVEFEFYEVGTNSTKQFKSILVFKNNSITTEIPRIKLANLNGVVGINTQYVGITDSQVRIDLDKPIFNLTGLTDVTVTPDVSLTNYALSSNLHELGIIPSLNNPYSSKYYVSYNLKPENLYVLDLDDITNTTNTLLTNRYIIRTVTQAELDNKTYSSSFVTDLYRLEYDNDPALSANLNANYYSFYNRKYRTTHIITDDTRYTLTINLSDYLIWVCDATVTNILKLGFTLDTNKALFGMLVLQNFTGIIEYPANIRYENGIKPRLEGSEHIIQIIQVNNTITLIQKSTNLFNEAY